MNTQNASANQNVGANIDPYSMILTAVSKKIRDKKYTDISSYDILTGLTLDTYCKAKQTMMAEENIAWGSSREIELRKNLSKQLDILLGNAVSQYDELKASQSFLMQTEIAKVSSGYELHKKKFDWKSFGINRWVAFLDSIICAILTAAILFFAISIVDGAKTAKSVLDNKKPPTEIQK